MLLVDRHLFPVGKKSPAEQKRASHGGHGGHGVMDKCYNVCRCRSLPGSRPGLIPALRGSVTSVRDCIAIDRPELDRMTNNLQASEMIVIAAPALVIL